ncbi:hypothetical protein N7471_002382 [Penicillium samsonianum]|uniref:uncharacterized protein n=1 Tax=Penicillium samsonianum TaxID=1882272 RepID=UPI002547CDA6|nr:uncharacterized protein N7471_002382 [Penicillium samsonianum]KAJ6142929.1 hypothetical protein N7471_002382 [Penicillium samsonianum]
MFLEINLTLAIAETGATSDVPTKPNQETASTGETGSTTQWSGTRSAEVTSHQRTWRSAIADDEDDEAWRRDPNLFVYDLPA